MKARPVRILAVVLLAGVIVAGGAAFTIEVTQRAAQSAEPRDQPRTDAPVAKDSVAPDPSAFEVEWPSSGMAAIALGDDEIMSSSGSTMPMASISKLVTAMLVLDERPLAPGEAGGDFWFTQRWQDEYHDYVARGESALKVPVDGMLTQYQLLQGMLIGSACNYADILVESVWGDHDAYVAAAEEFFTSHGITGVTMVEPTGIDPRNIATPAGLIQVGRIAMGYPVIAEIVATRSVELPGAGQIENTNDLLGDDGVVGIKTGTLDGSSLLSAKDISVDGETTRVFVVVMGQPDDDARFAASRALYRQAQAILSGS